MALLHWGDVIEDFLDDIEVSLSGFLEDVSGGWMFGYIEALRTVGVETVLVLVSSSVRRTMSTRHRPTGTPVVVLPVPRLHRTVRRLVPDRYASGRSSATRGTAGVQRAVATIAWLTVGYLATPPARLVGALRREGCAAVLCQEYEHERFDLCVVLGRLLHLPVSATFQGGHESRTPVERVVRPFSVRRAHALVIAPAWERERVIQRYGVHRNAIASVPNPLDLTQWPPPQRGRQRAARRELGLDEHARIVVWHGRVDIHRKGLDVLLAAWERVLSRPTARADARLLLIGTGTDASDLRERIARSRDGHTIRWVDEYITDRERLRRHLAAGDIAVLPSRHEGFPVAPVEALACGLPVVATDAPGVAEILEGEEASGGVIVPCEDPESLANALAALLDDEERRQQLAVRARSRAEEGFSLETVGRQLRAGVLPSVVAS